MINKRFLIATTVFFLNFFSSTAQVKEITRDWMYIVQKINVTTTQPVKFRLEAWAKVASVDSTAKAGFWVRVDNIDGDTGFFDNMLDRPILPTNTWKQYKIEGELTKNAKTLNFGSLCLGNGSFFFDDVKLFIEDDKGKMQPTPVLNSSFEKKLTYSKGNEWSTGTRDDKVIKVKGYELLSSNDAKEGLKSLLIKGTNIPPPAVYKVRSEKGYSPQIGILISMLDRMKERVVNQVIDMDQHETDYLLDDKANRIGALIMHLAAAEAYYQVYTFEGRGFNDEEKEKWQIGLDLGDTAREKYVGQPIEYYLKIYDEVRAKTKEEFRKRDDQWLENSAPGSDVNFHYSWFHVMEHQSSHLGQILMMEKRIPEPPKDPVLEKNVD